MSFLALFFFTAFQSLTPHALFFFVDLSIVLLFLLIGIWELKILHLCTFGSNFVYQGAKKKQESFSLTPEYGVRGHFTICFIYPLERFGKTLFSRQVSSETERHEPASVRLLTAGPMVFRLRQKQTAQRPGCNAFISPRRETASRPCKQARRYASTRSSRAMRC